MDSYNSDGQSDLEEESDDINDSWVDENSSSSEIESEDDSSKRRPIIFSDHPTKAIIKAEMSGELS